MGLKNWFPDCSTLKNIRVCSDIEQEWKRGRKIKVGSTVLTENRYATKTAHVDDICSWGVDGKLTFTDSNDMELKDKVAIITGGASGIGKAIADELLKHDCKVAICDIDEENGEKVCKQLTSKYGKDKVIFCECDVTDYPQFEESFDTAIETFGGVDIVVNNAGIMNDRLWELEVDVNLNGIIRGTLLALRYMGKDRGGKGGVLVNIGSNCSLKPFTSAPIYSATKHAIIGLTRAYGDTYHVSTTGVRVIALCPGATDTGLIKDIRKQLLSADYEKAWKKDTANSSTQKSEHVARSLVQCLPSAPSGSVWLVENSQPPRQIDYSKT